MQIRLVTAGRGPWPSAWRIRPLDESSKTVRADLSVAWQHLPCSVWLKRQCCRTCELRERFYELTQHVERSCECAKARTPYGMLRTWLARLARCSGRVYTCTRACSYRCARLRKADATAERIKTNCCADRQASAQCSDPGTCAKRAIADQYKTLAVSKHNVLRTPAFQNTSSSIAQPF